MNKINRLQDSWFDSLDENPSGNVDWEAQRAQVSREIYERFQQGLSPVSDKDLRDPQFDYSEALYEFCPTDINDVDLEAGQHISILYRGIPLSGTIQSIDLEKIVISLSGDRPSDMDFYWSTNPHITVNTNPLYTSN